MGAPRAIALCQSFNGALEFQVGHWAEAEESLHESIRLFQEIGAADGEALSYQRLGMLLSAQGQLAEGLSALEQGIVAAKHAKLRAHLQGRLYAAIARNRLLAGDVPAADDALSLGEALTESHGHCALCEALLLPVAVSVRIAQGELASAAEYCRQLDKSATRYGSDTWMALAAQARGELAAAQGDVHHAVTHYTAARTYFQKAKNEYAVGQCSDALAKLQV